MKHRPVHPCLASTLPQRQPRPGPVPDPTSKPGSKVAIDHDFHCTCLISQSNSFPLHFAGITVHLRTLKDSCISHCIHPTRTTRTQRNLLGDIRSPPCSFLPSAPLLIWRAIPFRFRERVLPHFCMKRGSRCGPSSPAECSLAVGRCKLQSRSITPHRLQHSSRFRRDSSARPLPPPLTKRAGDGGSSSL